MTAHANELTRRANPGVTGVSAGPSYPASVGVAFIDALARLGYDKDSLLSKTGVRLSDLTDPDAVISCEALGQLSCAALEQRPMKNLATHLAEATPLGAYPLVDYAVVTCETVAAAVGQLARYLRLAGAPYQISVSDQEAPIRVRYENAVTPFATEYGVALTLLHLRGETEGNARPLSVSFRHRPDDTEEIERILGCPVRANDVWDGFEMPPEVWGMPMRRRDPILRGVLEEHAEELISRLPAGDSVVSEVKRALVSRLGKADVQIRSVARALAISARSLQRRLADAGVTYQQVLDSTRREIAAKYLSIPTLSIAEIAYLLGYSETAAFHRAFKRWNGIGPQVFREQQT